MIISEFLTQKKEAVLIEQPLTNYISILFILYKRGFLQFQLLAFSYEL